MKVAHSKEAGRDRAPNPGRHQAAGQEAGGGPCQPGPNTTSWTKSLWPPSPSLPCIPGPSRPRELWGSCSPGAIRWACQSLGRVSDMQGMREGVPTLRKNPRKDLCQGGCLHDPARGERGSPCLGDLSPAPLDICQLGSSVLMDTVYPEPGWAKLAQCQACQESSNRSLSPTLMCPECPDFLDLAGRFCFAQAPNGYQTPP